jgi:hypothetical protein
MLAHTQKAHGRFFQRHLTLIVAVHGAFLSVDLPEWLIIGLAQRVRSRVRLVAWTCGGKASRPPRARNTVLDRAFGEIGNGNGKVIRGERGNATSV